MVNAIRTITVTSARGTKSVETALTTREAVEVLRPQTNNNFAQDLIRDFDHRSRRSQSLTNNKQNWLLVMGQEVLDRARAQATQPQGEQITGDFASLTALLQLARSNGTKFPRIRLQTETGKRVALSLAGEQSKTPGAIQVTDGGRRNENVWYGRISTDGRWQPSRDATQDVVALLHAFAADPVRVATEYGRLTGQCCFCASDLTDERSVLVGYGPHCAERYSLPYGQRPAKQAPVPMGDEEYNRAYAAAEKEAEQRGFLSDPDFQFHLADIRPKNHGAGLALALAELGESSVPWEDAD